VAALTREHGVVRGLAKGALRSGSAFCGGFEPLTRGHLGWLVKPGRELVILTEWMLEDVYWATRQDPLAIRAGIYALDLVSRLLRDEDPHPSVYDDLDRVLRSAAKPPGPSVHLLRFQWSILGHVGWQPDFTRDVETGATLPEGADVVGFRSSAGGVVAHPGAQDWRVRRETVDAMAALSTSGTSIEPKAAARASGLMAVYVRDLLGEGSEAMRLAFPELH
jgi:DNA repair protein RecO (recombination protein O)